MNSKINRRQFVKMTSTIILSNGIALAPNQSDAFLGVLFRFVFGGVGRTVIRNSARKIIQNNFVRNSFRMNFKSLANLSIAGGSLALVSNEVYALAKQYNAQSVWVNNSENNFNLGYTNKSSEQIIANLGFEVIDSTTGNSIQKIGTNNHVVVDPGQSDSVSHIISDLPFQGVVRLNTLSDNPNFSGHTSGNIVVINEDQGIFRH